MKRLLILLFTYFSINATAQEYILRAGREVYRFDENRKCWTEKPLPMNASLNRRDSIKSNTQFTVEVPLSFKNLFTKRVFTYIKYPGGVRLSEKLQEKIDCSTPLPTRVVEQGKSDFTIVEHIAWLINNSTSVKSDMDVAIDLYDRKNWSSIAEDMSIPKNLLSSLMIINGETEDVYTYILVKDKNWTSLWSEECRRISPFSYFEINLRFTYPLGEQTIVVIASTELLRAAVIEELVKSLNNNNPGTFNASLQGNCFVASKHFRLIE